MRVGWDRAWKMLALYVRSASCMLFSIFDTKNIRNRLHLKDAPAPLEARPIDEKDSPAGYLLVQSETDRIFR